MFGWFEATLTLTLSVAAITMSQLVLREQARGDKAIHAKLDEIIGALSGARNDLMHVEDMAEREIEEKRR